MRRVAAFSTLRAVRMVARTIAARENLGVRRQTFFVTFGGWDHHDELLDNQAGMLTTLPPKCNPTNNHLAGNDSRNHRPGRAAFSQITSFCGQNRHGVDVIPGH